MTTIAPRAPCARSFSEQGRAVAGGASTDVIGAIHRNHRPMGPDGFSHSFVHGNSRDQEFEPAPPHLIGHLPDFRLGKAGVGVRGDHDAHFCISNVGVGEVTSDGDGDDLALLLHMMGQGDDLPRGGPIRVHALWNRQERG